jgi:hypothetical protein
MVDASHFLWIYPGMASLKSFLYGMAPILGLTGAALYERQRVLTTLGVLEAAPGRGPGSGVPLTEDNIAAVIISVLAAENLSDVDQRAADLCRAIPGAAVTIGPGRRAWEKLGRPTFLTEVGRVLTGKNTVWRHSEHRLRHFGAIRVTRPCIGLIVDSPSGANPIVYHPDDRDRLIDSQKPISITAGIEHSTLSNLVMFTKGALSQVGAEGKDEP